MKTNEHNGLFIAVGYESPRLKFLEIRSRSLCVTSFFGENGGIHQGFDDDEEGVNW